MQAIGANHQIKLTFTRMFKLDSNEIWVVFQETVLSPKMLSTCLLDLLKSKRERSLRCSVT